MSGLFYFKKLLPLTVHNIFLTYIEHPIAKIFRLEVLQNNKFVLKYVNEKPKFCIDNQVHLHYYSGVSYLWWSKYLVRDGEILLPDEFDMNNLQKGDIVLDAISSYEIS